MSASEGALTTLSTRAERPLSLVANELVENHAAVIARIEQALATADSAAMSGPVRMLLQQQLQTARRALHEAQWLRGRMLLPAATAGASAEASAEVSSPELRPKGASATWSNFNEYSQPREHYSSKLPRYGRGRSDAMLTSKRVRMHSLSSMLRRLFMGSEEQTV